MTPQDQSIAYGLCCCGCGEQTGIIGWTNRRRGRVKGQRYRYVAGHQRKVRPVLEEAVPFKIDGEPCRLVPLTRGLYAIVDASDYEWLMQWAWYASFDKSTGCHYARRKASRFAEKGKHVTMHRQILGLGHGDRTKGDHAHAGETLDNRRSNLRTATDDQSAQNRRKPRSNTSGLKGVYPRGDMWGAQIKASGITRHLGFYRERHQAVEVYRRALKLYHGEYACEGR